MKSVNTKVQCLAAIFVPTGLYAFKRIGKLQKGIITYLICAGINGGALLLSIMKADLIATAITIILLNIISLVVPIAVMNKYCNEYNYNQRRLLKWFLMKDHCHVCNEVALKKCIDCNSSCCDTHFRFIHNPCFVIKR